MEVKKFLNKYFWEIIVIAIGSIFAYVLTFGTFVKQNNTLFIASKAWSDFASHIPLVRSFSLGSNFPPQYPLFPGEPIKYHFIFYSAVGFLEKLGIPIDVALNSLSFLGFLFLVFIIYFFASKVFKSKAVGILSTVFFLFNSSLSFVYFFQKYGLSTETINQIISNKDFLSFAPYGQGIVSAFWNLNIYTNQRHLAISYGLSLLLIYLIIKPLLGEKKISFNWQVILGVLLGLSFFLHTAVLLMTLIILGCFTIAFPKIRKECLTILIIAAVFAFPQYLYSKGDFGFSPKIAVGYLVTNGLTIQKFIQFWIYNLGLSFILIPLGFLASDKFQRKILFSFFILFLIGNLVQFSPEIAANHKFFNYFIIVGNMFSAFLLVKLWKRRGLFKPLVIAFIFFMTLGGIIDFFPIFNDSKVAIADYEINPDANWIKNNTPPNSIFLNTTFIFDPASLAGREIFQGWPYFAWSQGYNTDQRGEMMKQILGAQKKQTACNLLQQNNINYVEIKIQNPPDPDIPRISDIYNTQFKKSYENKLENYWIIKVKDNCK